MIDPRYMESFLDWAQMSYTDLERYGPIGTPLVESDWQNWGAGLLSLSRIASLGAPDPYEFSDWRDWATRLNQVLGQGT